VKRSDTSNFFSDEEMREFAANIHYKTSTPSGQKLEYGAACFVSVLGKISTAMRWHRLEILTTQWCGTGSPRLQFLAGWSTRNIVSKKVLF